MADGADDADGLGEDLEELDDFLEGAEEELQEAEDEEPELLQELEDAEEIYYLLALGTEGASLNRARSTLGRSAGRESRREREDGTLSPTSQAQKKPRGNLLTASTCDGDRKKACSCSKKHEHKVDSYVAIAKRIIDSGEIGLKRQTSVSVSLLRCSGQKMDGRCSSRSRETSAMSPPSSRSVWLRGTSSSSTLPPRRCI